MAIFNREDYRTVLPQLEKKLDSLIDMFYPVGSYYETSDKSFNPNTAWGGKWELESEGNVHVSSGDNYGIGDTGGSADAIVPYHCHSVDEVEIDSSGAHTNHTLKGYGATLGSGSTGWRFGSSGTETATGIIQGGAHKHTVPTHDTEYAGTEDAEIGANMPPYIVVNRWHRIK